MTLVVVPSTASSVPAVADRLVGAVQQRGLTVFARVDHAANARAVGLALGDEEVVVFGSARNGTILMQADARAGLDLPLRVLIWDDGGTTRLAYHDPHALADAYALDPAGLDPLADLLADVVAAAARG